MANNNKNKMDANRTNDRHHARQVRELQEQLATERCLSANLAKTNVDLKNDLGKEVRQIRFELTVAQETLGDYEWVNEKLTTRLVDNAHQVGALEDQLHATEEKRVSETSRLAKKASRLKKELQDSEQKINNTDAALSAILGELAGKCQAVASTDEIDRLIREIDAKMSQCVDRRSGEGRGRPARLLIGTIDGQEVRFPFFKERLTIGREQQNDIQLKAQFISRRHAVIYSDDDGARIVDWGSRNGISVNRITVSEQRLHSGDKVLIGRSEFVFKERLRR